MVTRALDGATHTTPDSRHSITLAASSAPRRVADYRAIRRLDAAGGVRMDEQQLVEQGYAEPEISDYDGLHEEGVGCEA